MSLTLTCINDAKVDLKTAAGIWFFDESSGNQAKDSSDKGNHGTLMEGPKWVQGKHGMALEFDGTNDYVISSSNVGISGNAERTVMFWFKPTSSDGRQSIVTWGAGGTQKMYWVEYNGYQFGPNNIWVGGWDADAYTEATLPLNQWYQVAVAYPEQISETKIYYNGVSQEVKPFDGNVADELETADSPVSIGYDLPNNRQPF